MEQSFSNTCIFLQMKSQTVEKGTSTAYSPLLEPCSTANRDARGPTALNFICSAPHCKEGAMRFHDASLLLASCVWPLNQPDEQKQS